MKRSLCVTALFLCLATALVALRPSPVGSTPPVAGTGNCGCSEADMPDLSPAIVWVGDGPKLTVEEIVTLTAPSLWFSSDEPLFAKGEYPFPHPHPCDEPSEKNVVYYQIQRISLRPGMEKVTIPVQDDPTFFEKVRDFTVRYYFYYREDVGMNGHVHDLEVAEFEIFLEKTDQGCYQVRMTRVTAFAHGTDWYSNELIIENDVKVPVVLFVEEGKHATCPDRNADGIYTPGYDVNVRINDAWGVRDVFGSGWLVAPGFTFAMFKPRRPKYMLLPPETPKRCLLSPWFSSLPEDILARPRYELRPANTVVMCDDVPPSRKFLMEMMKHHKFGAEYQPNQYAANSLKALAEPLSGTTGMLPSINLRWDRALGLSFALRGRSIEAIYLVPRATWIFKNGEFSIEGMITTSASRFMGSYFSAGAAYEKDYWRNTDGGLSVALEKRWNFVAETGIKFRFRLKGKLRIAILGNEFGGVRLGVRTSGSDSLKNGRFIAEIGAGVW